MPFYVVEPDTEYGPTIPWSLDKEEMAEAHETRAQAEEAAKGFAEDSPGTAFYIVEAIACVTCKITEPTITEVKSGERK